MTGLFFLPELSANAGAEVFEEFSTKGQYLCEDNRVIKQTKNLQNGVK